MQIEDQFNKIAEEYEVNRRKFIPCFDDLYLNTTSFIAAAIEPPKSITDLGAGTGLLSYFWYQHFPDAGYTLVDIADDMLSVARRRFQGADNVSYIVSDYSKALPDTASDAVISALSIHHLTDAEKQALFTRIYDTLPAGGIFVNYDQFCAGSDILSKWYDDHWHSQLKNSGLSEKDLALWKERSRLDKECSVEKECGMLRSSGFSAVECVYSYQKFSVVLAVK